MKSFLTLSVGFLAVSAFAAPPSANDSAEQKKAEELVRQLASPKYQEREKAATALVQMGRAARIALQDGKKTADPEVYNRCEQLLPQALALDLAYRLDRFVKDPEGKLEHDLPLWKQFREKIGADEKCATNCMRRWSRRTECSSTPSSKSRKRRPSESSSAIRKCTRSSSAPRTVLAAAAIAPRR